MTKNTQQEAESHESYGTITITRAQGNFDNLFASNIETNHAIHLTIQRAERRHEHAHDWIHGREELISVYLSPLQFAEFLTSMGQGEGTPCTINRVQGDMMEQPPETEATARKVVREFVEKTEDIAEFAKGADQLVKDILGKGQKMKKADREELQAIFTKMCRVVTDSAPFLIKQAEEHINTMVAEAKATITQHANVLGVEAGSASLPKALGGGTVEEGPVEFEPETDYEPEDRDYWEGKQIVAKPGTLPNETIFSVVDAPEIPDLPAREIDSLTPDEMNAGQVAEMVYHHLKRLEGLGLKSSGGGARFYMANAYEERGRVKVVYISYQGETALTLAEARDYLKGLEAGFQGRHFEFLRSK
jgi:hypothetical protein